MRSPKVAIFTSLALTTLLAQSQPNPPTPQQKPTAQTAGATNARTFTGTIVAAECPQASTLTSRSSYGDRSAAASPASSSPSDKTAPAASTKQVEKSVYDLQREVFKRCRVDNNKTTAFAVVTDDGSFYKLDDAGNRQVSEAGKTDKGKTNIRGMRVTVTGTPQGDTLTVQSLSKTDKPFSASS